MRTILRQILILMLSMFLLNCSHKQDQLTDNVWNHQKAEIKHDCKGCIDTIKKNIEFYIKHEGIIDLSKYDIGISLKGNAYEGAYKYPISIKDLCWCLDPSLNVSVITISVIDRESNKEFVYSQKNSFNLKDKSKVYIKLLNDTEKEKGEFKIKFDNDWLYR